MNIAATISSHINDAYKVLSHPITRAEYILTLNGSPCSSEDHPNMDPDFLSDIMDINEDLDSLADLMKTTDNVDILSHSFDKVKQDISTRWDNSMNSLKLCIEQASWDAAHQALSQLRYFERLKARLRELVPALSSKNVKIPSNL